VKNYAFCDIYLQYSRSGSRYSWIRINLALLDLDLHHGNTDPDPARHKNGKNLDLYADSYRIRRYSLENYFKNVLYYV